MDEPDIPVVKRKRVRVAKGPEAILNLIQTAYAKEMAEPDFKPRLKIIKEHFIKRNYQAVFQPNNLTIYLINYVPSRALTYFDLFTNQPFIYKMLQREKLKICCMGGGPGSEFLAFAATSLTTSKPLNLTINIYDNADWKEPLNPLIETTEKEWGITKEVVDTNVFLCDILEPTPKLIKDFRESTLLTMMFTVNEIFQQKQKAIMLISTIHENMKIGSFLLIVDSAGDFSEIMVGPKKYMIFQLFDFMKGFKPILSDDSKWHRVNDNLKFPLKLNSNRYFLRLYEKIEIQK